MVDVSLVKKLVVENAQAFNIFARFNCAEIESLWRFPFFNLK